MVMRRFCRSMLSEENLRKETLTAVKTSEDFGHSIWAHVLSLVEVNKIIAKNPDLTKTYEKSIESCTRSIKNNMVRLGADDACVARMMTFVNKGNTDNAMVLLLELLTKRNPGRYSRQLAACKAKVK